MDADRPQVLILNAALGGARGNTASALEIVRRHLKRRVTVAVETIAPPVDIARLRPALDAARGFVFGTGVHWDSWSSVLQAFLEAATDTEATRIWLGKPAAVVVTEHSTGGKAVLSRLQGVLATFGCEVPPMTGLVISRAATVARREARAEARDFWSPDDLRVISHNLAEAVLGSRRWRVWPVDRGDPRDRWLPPPG